MNSENASNSFEIRFPFFLVDPRVASREAYKVSQTEMLGQPLTSSTNPASLFFGLFTLDDTLCAIVNSSA